jgi:hypothetical protein
MEKDNKSNETVAATKELKAAAVIDTSSKNIQTSPIVIKIEAPKDAIKPQVKIDNNNKMRNNVESDLDKPTKSRLCQLFPILLFLVTFATVLSLLIIYMDPSSEYLFLHDYYFFLGISLQISFSKFPTKKIN